MTRSTLAESTNVHNDIHRSALIKTRKRTAIKAWDTAVAEWRRAPHLADPEREGYVEPWVLAIYALYGHAAAYEIETPAMTAGSHLDLLYLGAGLWPCGGPLVPPRSG